MITILLTILLGSAIVWGYLSLIEWISVEYDIDEVVLGIIGFIVFVLCGFII